MPSKIRPGRNIRSTGLPVDEECEAVIVTPYRFNNTSQEWEPETAGGGSSDLDSAREITLKELRDKTPDLTGAWDYLGGANGNINIPAGRRVIGIAAHSSAGGSLSINGGAAVPIPPNVGLAIQPVGNLVAPSISFIGTDSFFVEHIA